MAGEKIVINGVTIDNTIPIDNKYDFPSIPEERKKYHLLAEKMSPEGILESGGFFELPDIKDNDYTNEQIDTKLGTKVDKTTQTERDNAQDTEIAKKVNSSDYDNYKASQVLRDNEQDVQINSKASKTELSDGLALKADKADTYTKAQTDEAIDNYWNNHYPAEIFGVDFDMSTGTSVRLDSAKNLSFHKYIGGASSIENKVPSDFMQTGPWRLITQVLRDDNNTYVARREDENFETLLRTGNYNIFTRIPKYYVLSKFASTNGHYHWTIKVSLTRFEGSFTFIDKKFREIGSVVTAEKNGKHVSRPDTIPLVNTQAYTFDTKARGQGLRLNSWKDFLSWWCLHLVECADLNSQNVVGRGVCSVPYSSSESYKCQEITENGNTVIVKDNGYKLGMAVSLGSNWYNGSVARERIITDIKKHSNGTWLILTLNGNPFTTTLDTFCVAWGQPISTDGMLDMGLNSGWYQTDVDWSESICHSFVYGICDPWGNVFQATTGLVKYNSKWYVGEESIAFPKSLPSEGWTETPIDFAWIGEGYPKAWNIDRYEDNIILTPTEMGGNSGILFGDYLWGANDSIRLPWRGGSFSSGGDDGAVCLRLGAAGVSGFDFGGRLAYSE